MNFQRRMQSAKRADEWYYKRTLRNYSRANNEVLRGIFTISARKNGVSEETIERLIDSRLRYDTTIVESKRTFTSTILSKNDFFINPEWYWLSCLSAENSANFIDPLFDDMARIEGFVDKVTTGSEGICSDGVVDDIFLDYFDGAEGFIEFEKKHLTSYALLLEARTKVGLSNNHSLCLNDAMMRSFDAPLEYFSRRVFCDLLRGR